MKPIEAIERLKDIRSIAMYMSGYVKEISGEVPRGIPLEWVQRLEEKIEEIKELTEGA